MYLNRKQREKLGEAVHPGRVHRRQGRAYLEAWDVRATLIRIFGYTGFSIDTTSCELVYEMEKDGRWSVGYLAKVRLTIGGHVDYEDVAVGTATNQPDRGEAHDLAAKAAVSDALKRAAVNLGDQFGLGLYRGDDKAISERTPVIKSTLDVDNEPVEKASAEVTDDE